jgi:hypothetical protein
MKKLIFLLPLCFLLSNCSSDSSSSSSVNFKFTLDGYYDFISVPEADDPNLFWDSEIQNNGSTTYTISKRVKRAGSNPIFSEDLIVFQMEINTDGPLVVNQVYPIAACAFDNDLPFYDDVFDVFNCNSISLQKTGSTTGQIKITALNGDNLSGTFSFGNLINSNPINFYSGCSTQPSQNVFSISNGIFTNIPKF